MDSQKKSEKKAPFIYYVITGLIPVAFFVLLEAGLRFSGYGIDYTVFRHLEGYNSEMLYLNPKLSYKYFPNLNSSVFHPGIGFFENKPENSFRIFVLGGSSAQGYPYAQSASFPSHLQRRLDYLYPDRIIEVINLGSSAINTHTLLDILPEVLNQSPDLILIYAGHNEYYGALGPGSSGSLHPVFSKILLSLREYRTVQLLENLIKSTLQKETSDNASLMQKVIGESSIPLGSDTYKQGIRQFELNFSSMLSKIQKEQIPVIIGTISSNLAGHKPFVSDQKDEAGLSAQDHYEQAQSILSLDSIEAKSHYLKAKELDGLRFRAPQEINSLIHRKARELNIPLVDIDSIFNYNSPYGITGNNLMCDHLHPNMEGYFLISKAFQKTLNHQGLLPQDNVSISEVLLDSLLLKNMPYSRYDSTIARRTLWGLLGSYPFIPKNSPNPNQDKLDNDGFPYTIRALEDVDSIRMVFMNEYLANNDSTAFKREVRVFTNYLPAKEPQYMKMVNYLSRNNLLDQAYPLVFEELNRLKQSITRDKMIGMYYMHVKDYRNAVELFERAANNLKIDTELRLNLGFVHFELGEYEKAVEDYSQVIQLRPKNSEAYHQRAVTRFQLQDYKGTIEDMNQVLALIEKPDFLPYIIRGYARFGLKDREGYCEDWKSAAELGSTEAQELINKYCNP